MIKQFYFTNRGDPNRYYQRKPETTRPGQREPETNDKECVRRIPKAPGLESHHQMQFSVISLTLVGGWVLIICKDTVGVFYKSQPIGLKQFLIGDWGKINN